jgi:hypothetical protein
MIKHPINYHSSKTLTFPDSTLSTRLITFFKEAKFQHCYRCGGLLPELTFLVGNKEYRFCCYQIIDTESGEILKKTDYDKLGKLIANTT